MDKFPFDFINYFPHFQVQAPSAKLTKPPITGVYIKNLTLHNASWDATNGTLQESSANQNSSCDMPVIWLKPVDSTSFSARSSAKVVAKTPKYQCPLYMSDKSDCLEARFQISHLDLPTTQPLGLWAEKQVFLACKMLP